MNHLASVLFVYHQGFEGAVKDAVTKGFDEASCELYKQVMIKRAWLAEKDLPGNTTLVGQSKRRFAMLIRFLAK